jgi:hypothetical protein
MRNRFHRSKSRNLSVLPVQPLLPGPEEVFSDQDFGLGVTILNFVTPVARDKLATPVVQDPFFVPSYEDDKPFLAAELAHKNAIYGVHRTG